MTGVIVHEWIEPTGGAENVVEAFCDIYPDAPLLCLWNDAPHRFEDVKVRESVLARTPLRSRKALSLPFMPSVWRNQKATDIDWALVSSHLFAHHVQFKNFPDVEKFIYVHTPARYIWEPELDARGAAIPVRAVAPLFRRIDRAVARGPHRSYAANSKYVSRRIARCWDVEATVIYPPVDVTRIQSKTYWLDSLNGAEVEIISSLPSEFIFAASRLVEYKNIDAAIRAGEVTDTPVVIAGDGPDRSRLEYLAQDAGVPVHFLGRVSDEMLYALFQQCTVYVFAAIEDFGIMPVEAMAAGAGVVANQIGGTSESVVDGVTGALCVPDDLASLRRAVELAASCDASKSRARAREFSVGSFCGAVTEWVGPQRTSRTAAAEVEGEGR